MAYECDKCKRTYSSQYNLNKHLRISYMKPCYAKKYNKTCQYCNRIFSSVLVCKNHMNKTCKMMPPIGVPISALSEINQPDILNNAITIQLNKNISELQDKIALIMSKLNKIEKEEKTEPPTNTVHTTNNIGTANTNNIGTANTNNIGTINAPVTNYNINITPYDQPNNYIDNNTLKKILNRGFMSVQEFITKMHFNKDHPENHNVYISNKKDWNASYFNGTNWVLDEKNDILDTLYDNSSYYLITKYDELSEQLDEPTLTKFGRYKTACDDKKLTKSIKKDIKFILYNNKKIVLDTITGLPQPIQPSIAD